MGAEVGAMLLAELVDAARAFRDAYAQIGKGGGPPPRRR